MTSSGRFLLLDGARGVAAVGIVLFHLYSSSNPIFLHFFLFVDFFFVLSGFVLASSIMGIDSLQSSIKFLRKRYVRLAPMAYSAIILVILIQLAVNLKYILIREEIPEGISLDFKTLAFTFAFLQVLSINSQLLLYPLWSLSSEWLSNVIASLTNRLTSKFELFFFIAPGLIFLTASIFLRENTFFIGVLSQLGRCLLGFGLGLGLWKVKDKFNDTPRGAMCIFLAILASVVTLVLSQLSAELALFFSSPLFCFTVLLLYEYERQENVLKFKRSLRYLGNASYGIYVWHVVATNLLFIISKNINFNALEPDFGLGILRFLGVLALTLLLTELTIKFVESPIRNKFNYD